MDYESVLQLAKKNSDSKKEANRALPNLPPSRSADLLRKQELEKKKLLDANVARFLAKRQEDDKKRKNAANQKRDELLALRNQDSKARKRVKIMNKSAKSADKSAIQDAVGPNDYYIIEEPLCFMSQESLAQEEKFLEKMYNGPQEEKFSKGKLNTNKDLIGTKDRVKQALKLGDVVVKEKNVEKHRERKRDRRDSHEVFKSNDASDEEEPQQKVPRNSRPPPMNYQELLKLAEKLQQEPVKEAPREKEADMRPMTAKQREEYLCEEASRRRKEAGYKEEAYLKKVGKLPPLRETLPNSSMPRIPKKSSNDERPSSSLPRIPKLGSSSASPIIAHKSPNHKEGHSTSKHISRPTSVPQSVDKSRTAERHNESKHSSVRANSQRDSHNAPKSIVEKERAPNVKLRMSSNFNKCITKKGSIENSPTVQRQRPDTELGRKINASREVEVPSKEVPRPIVKHSRPAASSNGLDQRPPSNVLSRKPTIQESKRHSLSPVFNSKPRNLLSPDSKVKAIRSGPQADFKSKNNAPSVKSIPSATRQPTSSIPRHMSDVKPRQSSNLDLRQSSEARAQHSVDIKSRPSAGSSRSKDLSSSNARPQQVMNVKSRQIPPNVEHKQFLPSDLRSKQSSPTDVRLKQFPPTDVRPKQFPPIDVRPKQFPPTDVRPKQLPPNDGRDRGRLKANMKRRVIESDDDYDSEDAAFIDDEPDEGGEDYSKYIKEIFGYDKNRYKGIDDSDDRGMESSFRQQLQEEFTSTKIGILEDLEDIKKEKRREAMLKKKRKMK